ncbi:MAG TPA: sigma-70 family RNA polymerase sigma factor [Ferrovibrio sp.]|uniref:sigma-70 family RNA polymerase sigma factor n=1 Tax=Ferrovibrio sp. TaxID=1917215 RepID=UPI002ED40BFA
MNEADLAKASRFEALVLPHLDALYNYARRLTRDPHEAQDLVQEAILRAARYFESFRGDEARPWLFRILRNSFRSGRRRDDPLLVPLDDERHHPEAGGDPEAQLIQADAKRMVDAALAALPVAAREILVLREIEDFSYRQIAEILDLPVGTVMSRLARARDALAVELRRREQGVVRLHPAMTGGRHGL